MKGAGVTLSEIAETIEGAIRIIDEEAGENKSPKLTIVSVALCRCLEEVERMWEESA